MTDQLTDWWTVDLVVERLTGVTATGLAYDDPTAVLGMVDGGARLVTGPDGQQILAAATCYFPTTAADIPPQSRITLPAEYGGRTTTVIGFTRHDVPGQPLPAHLEVPVR